MKRALASVFLLISSAVLAADEPAAEPTLWPCVESVVIARITKVGELLDFDTEDSIVLHPPSYVDIRTTRVLWGRKPPKTLTIIHQPQRQNGAGMFLLGRREGWMGERKNGEPGWARIEGAYSVANRGLVLVDPGDLLAQRLAIPCERHAP
jgi:hypothetical protein